MQVGQRRSSGGVCMFYRLWEPFPAVYVGQNSQRLICQQSESFSKSRCELPSSLESYCFVVCRACRGHRRRQPHPPDSRSPWTLPNRYKEKAGGIRKRGLSSKVLRIVRTYSYYSHYSSSPDTSSPTRIDRSASSGDTPRMPGSGEGKTGVSHLPVREEVASISLLVLIRCLYFYLTHHDRRRRVVPDPASPVGDPSNSAKGYDGHGEGRGGEEHVVEIAGGLCARRCWKWERRKEYGKLYSVISDTVLRTILSNTGKDCRKHSGRRLSRRINISTASRDQEYFPPCTQTTSLPLFITLQLSSAVPDHRGASTVVELSRTTTFHATRRRLAVSPARRINHTDILELDPMHGMFSRCLRSHNPRTDGRPSRTEDRSGRLVIRAPERQLTEPAA